MSHYSLYLLSTLILFDIKLATIDSSSGLLNIAYFSPDQFPIMFYVVDVRGCLLVVFGENCWNYESNSYDNDNWVLFNLTTIKVSSSS